jgi:hypothetical protein
MPGLGKKTFTAGDVLIAGDVNNYLMDQTVMNFATTAARSSAIPTPSTGMVSYVGDTGSETPASTIPQIQAYTGAAWQNLDGLTLLSNTAFTTAASVTVDNVFTATYTNYKILINISTVSSASQMTLVFRSAVPADLAAASSVAFMAYNTGTGISSFGGGGGQLGFVPISLNPQRFDLTLFNPESTTRKDIVGLQSGTTPSFGGQLGVSMIHISSASATAATGFKVAIASGTFTGEIRVYGIRNS